jgi:uncharacterized membrane protein
MEFQLRPGSTGLQTLNVVNQDNQPSDYEVYVEGENDEWFTIVPGKFTLNGKEQKVVDITVNPPVTADSQEHNSSICILSVPPGSDLRIGAGIKVPVKVNVSGPAMEIGTVAGLPEEAGSGEEKGLFWGHSPVLVIMLAAGAFVVLLTGTILIWMKRRHD